MVVFAGDGDFLMHGQEFATAVQYRLPIIVVLLDNGMYGTIRMHQEREYPHRVSGYGLQNPDFAAYAQAFGGHGIAWNAPRSSPRRWARFAHRPRPRACRCCCTASSTLRRSRRPAGR